MNFFFMKFVTTLRAMIDLAFSIPKVWVWISKNAIRYEEAKAYVSSYFKDTYYVIESEYNSCKNEHLEDKSLEKRGFIKVPLLYFLKNGHNYLRSSILQEYMAPQAKHFNAHYSKSGMYYEVEYIVHNNEL